MGCDIHGTVEKRIDNVWVMISEWCSGLITKGRQLMGCDIHGTIERAIGGEWVMVDTFRYG